MDSQPPSYQESAQSHPPVRHNNDAENPSDPPPSYDSLFGRVRHAKEESETPVGFCRALCVIIMSTIGCTICLAILLAVPISMIVIGTIHKDDCPVERFIPIYLIVAGVFGCIKCVSSLIHRQVNKHNNNDDDNVKTNPFDGLVSCFLLAWFIAGNVWVYRTHGHFQHIKPDGPDYCDFTVYWFAFWMITSSYIIIAFSCCCIVCAGCVSAATGKA